MLSTPRDDPSTLSTVADQHEYPSPPPYSYPPAYPTNPGYPYQQVPMVVPTSGWATSSLVFAVLGLVTGCCTFGVFSAAAVLCGHIALRETKSGQRSGHGMAVGGLIMGYLIVGPALAISIMAVFGSGPEAIQP